MNKYQKWLSNNNLKNVIIKQENDKDYYVSDALRDFENEIINKLWVNINSPIFNNLIEKNEKYNAYTGKKVK